MKPFLTIALSLCTIICFSQVKFEQLSVDEAIRKAAATGKIAFVQLETEGCSQCNDVANKSFATPQLGDEIAKKFIAIKIGAGSNERGEFIKRYSPTHMFGTFFILGNGDLIHTYFGTSSLYTAYVREMETAYKKWTEGLVTVKELDEEWNNNPGNVPAMEKNLDKRLSVGLPTDSLLDIYVQRLAPDSFHSKRVLAFIANKAPLLGSMADNTLRKDIDFYNMAWYSLPYSQRTNINNSIVSKSMAKAIKAKDESLVNRVADFQASAYDNQSPEVIKRTRERLMVNYYHAVNDTAKYIKAAIPYFDRYYMSYPVRLIQQQDSIRLASMLQNIPGDTIRDANDPSKVKRVVKKSGPFAPSTQYYALELNTAAWNFYTHTNDKYLLSKALQWTKRSNEFFENGSCMDTYARLLYKTGNTAEALEWETKAVEFQKKRQYSYKNEEEVLEKMKRSEQIDQYSLKDDYKLSAAK